MTSAERQLLLLMASVCDALLRERGIVWLHDASGTRAGPAEDVCKKLQALMTEVKTP